LLLGQKDPPNIDPGCSTPSAQLSSNYVGSMTEGVDSRARKMSQSSNEREMSTDVKADPEPESRGAKRKFSTDVVDYPRRRATIAVRR
jgi:hypothetical protein